MNGGFSAESDSYARPQVPITAPFCSFVTKLMSRIEARYHYGFFAVSFPIRLRLSLIF